MDVPLLMLDMDQFFVDYAGGVFRTFGRDIPRREWQWDIATPCGFKGIDDPAFWKPQEGAEWWSRLDPQDDGMALVHYLLDMEEAGQVELCVCSSSIVRGSSDGKRDWMKTHLPQLAGREVFATRKGYPSGSGKLLLDDRDANCDDFEAAGGRAVVIPRPHNRAKSKCLPHDGYSFDPDELLVTVKEQLELMKKCDRCRRLG